MSGWPRVHVSAAVNHLVRGVDLFVFLPHVEDGSVSVGVGPVAFERVAVDALPGPLLSLGREEAQRLMDDLWHAGLRPTQAVAGDAVLAAMDRHIGDLQRLVFGGGLGAGEGVGSGLAGALVAALAGAMAAPAVVLPEFVGLEDVLPEDGTDGR